MKNVFLTAVIFFTFVSSAVFGQNSKPGITDIDRMNIREILKTKGEQTNPDYVWQKAKVVELKDLLKEEYESSYLQRNADSTLSINWKTEGPAKRDFVLAYKTEKNGTIYLRNLSTGELLRPVYTAPVQSTSNVRLAKNTQPQQKVAKQPKGDGRGLARVLETGANVMGAINQVSGGRFGQGMGGGNDLGLGGGRGITNVVGYQGM